MTSVRVVRQEKLTSKHQLGITRHHLSNGWWIDDDPRTSRDRGSRFSLWRPGRSKATEAKWLRSANSVKALLKVADELRT